MSSAASPFQPLPGRSCGDCSVCCIELEIDDPQMKKPEDVACPHMLQTGGCGIYAARPHTCASWFCGWRMLRLSDAMRPDLSGVLLIPEMCHEAGHEKGGLRIVGVGGDPERILQDEILDLAGRCVAGGVPIFLSHGSGPRTKRLLLNPLAEPVVRAGFRDGFLAVMKDALAKVVTATQASSTAP